MGHVGMGWVMQGLGALCRVGVSCRGGLSHAGVGWGGSCKGGVCPIGVGWVISGGVGHAGCSGSYSGRVGGPNMDCGKVCKLSLNNLIGHKLGILHFLLTNYFMVPAIPPHPCMTHI